MLSTRERPVTREMWSGYERSVAYPSIPVMDRLRYLYGVTPDWILYGEPEDLGRARKSIADRIEALMKSGTKGEAD